MADLSSSGRVQSADQIRQDRERKGLCTTCRNDQPVKCFEIKKRIGGFFKDKIPLTEEGKVEQGTCLKCHPHYDPRNGRGHDPLTSNIAFGRNNHHPRDHDRAQSHRQFDHGQTSLIAATGRTTDPEEPNRRSQSESMAQFMSTSGPPLRKPTRQVPRQANFRLSKSLPIDAVDAEEAPWVGPQRQQRRQEEYVDDIGIGGSSGRKPKLQLETGHKADRYSNMDNAASTSQRGKKYGTLPNGHNHTTERLFEEYIEEHTSENIARYPTKSTEYSPSRPNERDRNYGRGNYREIPYAQDSNLYPSTYDYRRGEEMDDRKLPSFSAFPKREDRSNSHLGDYHEELDGRRSRDSDRYRSSHDQTRGDEMEDEKLPSPTSAKGGSTGGTDDSGSDAQLDNLQRAIRDFIAQNPNKPIKFVPNEGGVVLPNSELHVEDTQDDPSVLTQDTYFRDMPSVATMGTRFNTNKSQKRLNAIDESSTTSSHQPSMISHQIREPAIPDDAASHEQVMESYMNSPNLKALSEFIEMFNTTGLDEEAIDALTTALIQDNDDAVKSNNNNTDLALFCLTKLWLLARKSDGNKRIMIFDENGCAEAYSSLEAVKETAKIYTGSYQVQHGVCAVLWSLSMKYQNHVAQNGGCKVILDAIEGHLGDVALQVMALGALKVISFESVGQSILLSQDCLSIIVDVMRMHVYNPEIQSLGCVILGNLAVDEASQSATTVSEREIDVIIKGMIAHPNSLEVQEAACFTLSGLASSPANVALIRDHSMSNLSVSLALKHHARYVGQMISTLLQRFKYV